MVFNEQEVAYILQTNKLANGNSRIAADLCYDQFQYRPSTASIVSIWKKNGLEIMTHGGPRNYQQKRPRIANTNLDNPNAKYFKSRAKFI